MLNLNDIKILVVPPWENAGDDHWISHLERKYPDIERVEQDDWDNPRLSDWLTKLDEHVSRQTKPVVIIAHSLGAATFVRWPASGRNVKAAFLVAPPDLEQGNTPEAITEFGPLPTAWLRFPSILVASENDPYISLERARYFADAWGSEFVNIGEAGHINPKSGYGIWTEAETLVRSLIERSGSAVGS